MKPRDYAAMGRAGKGKPKNITAEESIRRGEFLASVRYRGGRKPGATNLVNRRKRKAKGTT